MDRLIATLERIAVALERQADADPIAALGAVLGQDAPAADGPLGPPQGPAASNGRTTIYRHPNPAWEIAAFKVMDTASGWRIVERRTDG